MDKSKIKTIEIVGFAISIILIILVLVFQFYTDEKTIPISFKLISQVIYLVASGTIGWILDSIRSRTDYIENLKNFAISAERRTNDLLKANSRITEIIQTFMKDSTDNQTFTRFQSLFVNLQTINDSIQSSKGDWADVIGEEIKEKERLEMLEGILHNSNYELNSEQIESIRSEIADIRRDIPSLLIYKGKDYEPLQPYFADFVAELLIRKIQNNKGILNLEFKFSPENLENLQKVNFFNLTNESNMNKLYIHVLGDDSKCYGLLRNPLEGFREIRPTHILYTLLSLLSIIQPYTSNYKLKDGTEGKYSFENINEFKINEESSTVSLLINAKKLIA